TFKMHCFNLILGYILVNHQMPRMYATTWLERLFQSCQHQHRLLSYEKLPLFGNDALIWFIKNIWFWAIWKCAQFCVMNKLKTSLGKPQETSLVLEGDIDSSFYVASAYLSEEFFSWSIHNNTKKVEASSSEQTNLASTPSSTINPPASELEFVITSFVQSPINLHNSMAIRGIYVWLKNIHQLDWSWIQAFEQAAYEYKLLLNEHFKSLSMINEKKEDKISGELVKAMSCFENRDFEGLKVSMRRMTNSQVTGGELGRSMSCGWDMEAFDMLATVETLKRVSKRRQVTALYQSENREVPLLPGRKFAAVQHSVRSLNSIFLYSQPSFNNQRSPLRSFHSDASSIETYSLVSLVTMIERYQNVHMITIERETEAGKLMHTLSLNKVNNINLTIAIEFLSRSILRHLINDSQPNPQYNNQRSLINIEKCSRNLLHIAQWSRTAIEIDHEATTKNVMSIHLQRKQLSHVFFVSESFVRKNILFDKLLIGKLLNFSTLKYPNLAKSWFRFAAWAYLWGRELLA
ncbi:unnamed protein product, partial [Rotaria magnacalcarata]